MACEQKRVAGRVHEFLGAVAANTGAGGSYPTVERGPDPQVFGILLTSVSRSSLEEKDYVRVSLMVVKTLASGFGSGNYNKVCFFCDVHGGA